MAERENRHIRASAVMKILPFPILWAERAGQGFAERHF